MASRCLVRGVTPALDTECPKNLTEERPKEHLAGLITRPNSFKRSKTWRRWSRWDSTSGLATKMSSR